MTQQITDKLNEMRQLREKATQGEWIKKPLYFKEEHNEVANVRGIRLIGKYGSVSCGEEAHFILTAANNWMTLITCLEKAVEEFERIKMACEDMRGYFDRVPKARDGHEEPLAQAASQHMTLSIECADETLTEIEKLLSGGKG